MQAFQEPTVEEEFFCSFANKDQWDDLAVWT